MQVVYMGLGLAQPTQLRSVDLEFPDCGRKRLRAAIATRRGRADATSHAVRRALGGMGKCFEEGACSDDGEGKGTDGEGEAEKRWEVVKRQQHGPGRERAKAKLSQRQGADWHKPLSP